MHEPNEKNDLTYFTYLLKIKETWGYPIEGLLCNNRMIYWNRSLVTFWTSISNVAHSLLCANHVNLIEIPIRVCHVTIFVRGPDHMTLCKELSFGEVHQGRNSRVSHLVFTLRRSLSPNFSIFSLYEAFELP